MSDDGPVGHVEAAEVLGTRKGQYEEASDLADVVPDGFRVIEVSSGEGYHIERETRYCDKWVPVARFTEHDAKYEWGEEIDAETGDGYRCVVDYTADEVWLEVLVTDE